MKSLIIIFLLCHIHNVIHAQLNLIPNPSFEEYYDCKYKLIVADIKDVITYWTARKSSPSYINLQCYEDPTSDYFHDARLTKPIFGNGYVITTLRPSDNFLTNLRKYLQVKLNEEIVPGKVYSLTYYMTLPYSKQNELSRSGIYFSDTVIEDDITNIGFVEPILLKPQLEIDTIQGLTHNEWKKVTHCFESDKRYSVMTVGIFANVKDIIGEDKIKNGLSYLAYDNFELYEIDSLIELELTDNDTICVGDCVTLSTNHSLIDGEFIWDLPGSDILTSLDSVVTVCYNRPGTYDVGISVDHCIGSYDNYFKKAITVIPAIDHTPPWEEMTVCAGEEVEIDLSLITYNILWEDGSVEKRRTFLQDGIYKYTLSNGYCENEYSVKVIYDIHPTTQLIEVQSCNNESIEYNDRTYNMPGVYNDTLLGVEGCDSIFYEIRYSYFEILPIQLDGPFGFCHGETLKLKLLSDHTDLTWSDGSSQRYIVVDIGGVYTIKGLDKHLCQTELKFEVEAYPNPEVETEDLLDIWYEEGLNLPVTYLGAISSYSWSNSGSLNCSNCAFPHLIKPTEGLYEIEIENEYGCSARSVLEIRFKKVKIYIANTIAKEPTIPNNGIFYVQSDIDLKYNLSIYDRWGDLVFEGRDLRSNTSNEGWHPKGNVNPGVFVYKIMYEENGKRIVLAGDVTVL